MKIISRKVALTLASAVWLLAVHVPAGHAHDMWINMQDYALGKSKPAVLSVASAHHFVVPGGDLMARAQVDKVVFYSPDGKEVPAAPRGDTEYQSKSPLEAPGTYMAVAVPQNGFVSLTPEGRQRGKTKKDLKDVVECRYSEKSAKALFTVGAPGGSAFSRPLGHKLEIIPLKDPATLKAGEDLPVKVLFKGQPARTYVYGTYAGFSNESSVFAYTVQTDKEGIAKVKLIKPGTWLLLVKQEMPYPDATVCDTLAYAAALTFQVR